MIRIRVAFAAFAVALLLVVPLGARAERVKGITQKVQGRLGYLALKDLPAAPGNAGRGDDDDLNPETPRRPPASRGTGTVHSPPSGEAPGSELLPNGPDPTGSLSLPWPIVPRLARVSAHAAAADDFEAFRNQPVVQGSDSATNAITLETGEPSVANDRDTILFTGNKYAAVSTDDGLHWTWINPVTMFKAKDGFDNDGGFCCDQVAYSVDRGPYALVLWLQQYFNDSSGGRLRLIVYQGRQELSSQADFCTIDFRPQKFPKRDYPKRSFFDFNHMSASNKFLYLSSKVLKANGTMIDGLVWRIPLDQLDDSGRCDGPTDRDKFTITSWSGSAAGFNPALVENADRRMFWASHCKDDSDNDHNENQCTDTSRLIISEVDDSSDEAKVKRRQVDKFALMERPQGRCALPDGTDPCRRENDRVLAGYRRGKEVGWMWQVKQGGEFPFPYIRLARFDTDKLKLIEEDDLWNADHAYLYPAAGVNSAGNLGLTVTAAGGGLRTREQAALIDDVPPDKDFTLTFHALKTSDSGVDKNTWGDYAQVRPYDGCPKTYAAATHVMLGGSTNADAQGRFAWFGRERDGCPDLAVTALSALAGTLNNRPAVFIGSTTTNIGSGSAAATTTRFYVSRDTEKSDDDVRLDAVADIGPLGHDQASGQLVTPSMPAGRGRATCWHARTTSIRSTRSPTPTASRRRQRLSCSSRRRGRKSPASISAPCSRPTPARGYP